ncbi:hypothetical protein [Poseidonocella sp. HB161398]|uniref:hypothetical protein n=1 Tax=Poseidonocella sp. HB161398 TaxID=2320855 RepID=UPI0011094272|nr:hypothetical protein [Poseidonocella sp. HB161398]
MPNSKRNLAFADDFIYAELVEDVRGYQVEDAIAINLSPRRMITGSDHPAIVPAWKSTWLKGGTIAEAERVALIKVRRRTNLGGAGLRGWDWLGDRIRSFPRDTPLYISPFDHCGEVVTDPLVFTNERSTAQAEQAFDLRLNLWWSPGDTDCFIHNEHPFLEVHTQIHGTGRMQKFHGSEEASIYEDIPMSPGATHDPFCRVTGHNQWTYPWHRYYADTDCVWLAIELHPKG